MRLAWLLVVAACHHGAAPAPPPTCAAAAEHVRALLIDQGAEPAGYAAGVHESFLRRCTADVWSTEMRACVLATRSLRAPRRCKAEQLTGEQRRALEHDLATVDRNPIARALARQACADYHELIRRIHACPALPAAARAALAQNYRDTALQWRRTPPDPASHDALCRTMADSLRQAVAPICGW